MAKGGKQAAAEPAVDEAQAAEEAAAKAEEQRLRDAKREEAARQREAERAGEVEEGEEPTHETERLIAEAPAWLGVPSHVAAGALVNSNKNVTVSEARSAVEEFLKTPVEVS